MPQGLMGPQPWCRGLVGPSNAPEVDGTQPCLLKGKRGVVCFSTLTLAHFLVLKPRPKAQRIKDPSVREYSASHDLTYKSRSLYLLLNS